MPEEVKIIVIGGLNTDIIALGVNRILKPGELTRSGSLKIGPGGKSRNMAQMMAALLGAEKVAMIGKTIKDKYGLWKIPVDSLIEAHVNTDYISILEPENENQMPGVALIPVTDEGQNQIYCIPGINDDFSSKDIDNAEAIFAQAAKQNGILAFSLELPLGTAVYATAKAKNLGLKVVLDPGGIEPDIDYSTLLKQGITTIKPNEHETRILTGIEVIDLTSAEAAANVFFQYGIKEVVITCGEKGIYLIDQEASSHIPIPKLPESVERDETGCGDQTMAVLCAEMVKKASLMKAVEKAIVAGSMQYQKAGIEPVSQLELEAMISTLNKG